MKSYQVLLICLLAAPSAASDEWRQLYGEAKLEQEKPRFERLVNALFTKAISPNLTEQERRGLSGVSFELPLGQHPLEFYSTRREGRQIVVMPVLSMLFVEDLFVAYAWLHTRGYSLETIDEYITMLKYKEAAEFPGGGYPPPLKALHIPGDALSDKRVDELSLRLRNSGVAFILLHELGHCLYRHSGYNGVTAEQARQQEGESDRFALDILARTSTIPMGAMLYFQAQAYFQPSKGQFRAEGRSEREWETHWDTEATHPLTPDRLREMALYLYNQAGDRRDAEILKYIATRLNGISEILEIEDLQGCMAVVADRSDPSILAPRRPNEMTRTLLERWCGGNQGDASSRSVVVNGVRLSDEDMRLLERVYRIRVREGEYWYDPLTGAWGRQGGPTMGFIQPALKFGGRLRADASSGDTGVFVNGRELHRQDVIALREITGVVLPGRYWMDAQGNYGYEGGPRMGNIWAGGGPTRRRREGILSTYDKTGVMVLGQ